MKLVVDDKEYDVIIEKKRGNKNTYIRVKKDFSIHVTASIFTKEKEIKKLIEDNYSKIVKMIDSQKIKEENNQGFNYLGKNYDIVYLNQPDIVFGEEKVFLSKTLDINKWYKKQAQEIFKERLDYLYEKFSDNIPYPTLKIRLMKSRWGVCNIKTKSITLNLELIKRDMKYLDYVIIHELAHLIYPDHSSNFWSLVSKNCSEYKQMRKEMKEF